MSESRLPQRWREAELGTLGTCFRGRGGTRSDEQADGLPCIRYGDLYTHHGCIVRSFCSAISPAAALAYTALQSGDLVLAGSGETPDEIGKATAFCNSGTAYAGADTIILRPSTALDPRFAGYALNSVAANRYKSKMGQGSSVFHISREHVSRLCLRFPENVAEQQLIAEILQTVDEALEETQALIAKTQQIKAGLMHDLFTRGVTPDGQLRPPREEAPKLYKESPIGWIPNEWEIGRLSDKRSSGRPHLKTGPFGSSLKLEHWVDVGRPVVTIGALGEGEFLLGELLHISEETAERLREYQLGAGDVVFSRVADVGRSATIGEEHRGWVMSSNLMRISLDRGAIVPDFLQAQLAYDARVRRQIWATVNAGGRDVANSATLNRLHFPWPCKQEQERVVERFAGLVRSRQANIALLNKLRLIKAGLMHDLLTGRVRVSINEPKGVAV